MMDDESKDKVIKAGAVWWQRMDRKKLSPATQFIMMGSFVAGAQAMEPSITDKDAEDLIATFTGVRI